MCLKILFAIIDLSFHTFCAAKLLLFFDMCKSLRYFLLKIVYFIAVLRPVLVTFVASKTFCLLRPNWIPAFVIVHFGGMIAAAYVCFLPAMLSPFPAFLFARGVGGLPLPVLPIVRRNPTKPSAALSSPPTVKIYESCSRGYSRVRFFVLRRLLVGIKKTSSDIPAAAVFLLLIFLLEISKDWKSMFCRYK